MIPYSIVLNRVRTCFWSCFYHWGGALSSCHRKAVFEGMVDIVQTHGRIEIGAGRICRNIMLCVTNGGIIRIGAAAIGPRTIINCRCRVTIGDNVMIAADVSIFDNNHEIRSLEMPISRQGYQNEEVVIADDVWIGTKSVILPGVHIARGAVIGAGSIVTHDVMPYAVVAGVPARQIGSRIQ